ncbi:MAG: NUDIX hydrolase [Acidobacteriota bacterium]|nr:NUDIX hydrolase [Acidobacteriota bacterium]MDE3190332.1 NUDIX hydrolase [Acidobacteriota bacterium]
MRPDASRVAWRGKLIAVTVEQWDGREREIVEHPGAVAIVAVDRDGRIAFIRQLREATRLRLLELPAGTREPGEGPLETAKRELHEECGFTGGEWTRLGGFWTTPGFTREYMDVFLAEGVDAGAAAPEPDEELELVLVHRDEIRLADLEDTKSIAGLALYFGR